MKANIIIVSLLVIGVWLALPSFQQELSSSQQKIILEFLGQLFLLFFRLFLLVLLVGVLGGLVEYLRKRHADKVRAQRKAQKEAEEQREAEKAKEAELRLELSMKQHEDAFNAFAAQICADGSDSDFHRLLEKPMQAPKVNIHSDRLKDQDDENRRSET